jgi:hypothetical protein
VIEIEQLVVTNLLENTKETYDLTGMTQDEQLEIINKRFTDFGDSDEIERKDFLVPFQKKKETHGLF